MDTESLEQGSASDETSGIAPTFTIDDEDIAPPLSPANGDGGRDEEDEEDGMNQHSLPNPDAPNVNHFNNASSD